VGSCLTNRERLLQPENWAKLLMMTGAILVNDYEIILK